MTKSQDGLNLNDGKGKQEFQTVYDIIQKKRELNEAIETFKKELEKLDHQLNPFNPSVRVAQLQERQRTVEENLKQVKNLQKSDFSQLNLGRQELDLKLEKRRLAEDLQDAQKKADDFKPPEIGPPEKQRLKEQVAAKEMELKLMQQKLDNLHRDLKAAKISSQEQEQLTEQQLTVQGQEMSSIQQRLDVIKQQLNTENVSPSLNQSENNLSLSKEQLIVTEQSTKLGTSAEQGESVSNSMDTGSSEVQQTKRLQKKQEEMSEAQQLITKLLRQEQLELENLEWENTQNLRDQIKQKRLLLNTDLEEDKITLEKELKQLVDAHTAVKLKLDESLSQDTINGLKKIETALNTRDKTLAAKCLATLQEQSILSKSQRPIIQKALENILQGEVVTSTKLPIDTQAEQTFEPPEVTLPTQAHYLQRDKARSVATQQPKVSGNTLTAMKAELGQFEYPQKISVSSGHETLSPQRTTMDAKSQVDVGSLVETPVIPGKVSGTKDISSATDASDISNSGTTSTKSPIIPLDSPQDQYTADGDILTAFKQFSEQQVKPIIEHLMPEQANKESNLAMLNHYVRNEQNKQTLSELLKNPEIVQTITQNEVNGYSDIHEKFKRQYHPIQWRQHPKEASSSTCSLEGQNNELITTIQESKIDSDNSDQQYSAKDGTKLTGIRNVALPSSIPHQGSCHISLACQNMDGEKQPLFLTLHYKDGKLVHLTKPTGITICKDHDPKSPLYLEYKNPKTDQVELLTMPVNQKTLEELENKMLENAELLYVGLTKKASGELSVNSRSHQDFLNGKSAAQEMQSNLSSRSVKTPSLANNPNREATQGRQHSR